MAVNMTQLDPVRGSSTTSLLFPSTPLLSESDWYQREVSCLPRLTEEEEAVLLHDIHLAHQGGLSLHQAKAAKQRLIEGYLPRVVTLARQYDRHYRVVTFDDLVQEGGLALIQAIDKCATMPITKSLSAFVGTVVRSAFARAIATDAPIHMPNSTWHYIHQTGRAHEFAWMQTMRLDVARNADGETFADTLVAPSSAPTVDEQDQTEDEQRHRLARSLASLTKRQRQVLTLRYGLDPADARAQGTAETARLLGISPGSVYAAEQRTLVILRQMYQAERATASAPPAPPTDGCAQATPPPFASKDRLVSPRTQQYHQRQHQEQQARLDAAYHRLQEQGQPITSETLSAAAHADHRAACVFVKLHSKQSAKRARIRSTLPQQRLEEACAQMVEEGVCLSISGLKAAAHIGAPAARAFLWSRGAPPQKGGLRKRSHTLSNEMPQS
jgi:RNA polymerase sigma factor (sigma-70 family)